MADQIKNQIEMNKAEKENRLKTLRKRLKFLPEDVEESQRIVSLIQKTSENLRREEEFKSVDPNFQQVAERVREQQKKLDTQNLPAYEQSVQVINMRYELVENLFKPIGQLASFYSEELASAVRNAFSSVTKVHELSQTYLNAAIEMGSSAGPDLANKGKGGGSVDFCSPSCWLTL